VKEGFILGGSAQGRVALDILRLQFPATDWYFIDDNPEMHGRLINGAKVAGGLNFLETKKQPKLHIALGNPSIKLIVVKKCKLMGIDLISAVHPGSIISETAVIGKGVTIGAGAIVNTNAKIGNFALINTGALIENDSVIGDYANISPGACIGGRVKIGSEAFIGSGAIVLARQTIGKKSVIGMGAIVTKSIPASTLAYGVPARIIRKIDSNFDWSSVL
jgi:sugar O-acyltransferase (sialic acid O-acetyltransferase NeuD family)